MASSKLPNPSSASETDQDAIEAQDRALSSPRPAAVVTSALYREVAARPDLLQDLVLAEALVPEALRHPGQWVVRSEDLLAFHLELVNLRAQSPSDGKGLAVLAVAGRGSAYIALHFAPQAIAERVFYAAAGEIGKDQDGHYDPETGQPPPSSAPSPLEPLAEPPIGTRIAYPSRLVFRFDEAKLRAARCWPVPYTLEGILTACRALNLNVATNARYQPPRRMVEKPVFTKPSVSRIAAAFARLSLAERAATLASALRNRQLAGRLGAQASAVLARRGDLPYPPPSAARAARVVAAVAARAYTPASKVLPQVLPTTPGGLALSEFVAQVSARPAGVAKIQTVPRPRKPGAHETAVELPFRLLLSPNGQARFAHATRPAASAATGHTALWHTRLAERDEADSGVHQPLDEPIRAIWARGGPQSNPSVFVEHWPATPEALGPDTDPFHPFRQTLDDRDRHNIVHLSGNFALAGGNHEPIDCQRLMLSSLGGWLDARGAWRVPNGLSVEQWVHHAAQARDHYVRVIYKGYLLPFGHRVSLVKVSERFFLNDRPDNAAYLLQRMYLIVREPVREFPETTLATTVGGKPQYYHRAFPFPVVRLLTEVTPDIADPDKTEIGGHGMALFWPALSKPGQQELDRFRFNYVATDLDGSEIHFDLPGIFIDNALANPAQGSGLSAFQAAQEDWLNAPVALRTADLGRQRVALAPSVKPGDTANELESMVVGAETADLDGKIPSPLMRPSLLEAQVRLPAVSALSGGTGTNVLRFDADYLSRQSGYGAGEVYARLDSGGETLDFRSCGNRSGGFVQPSLTPSALSRKKGPVSGDAAAVGAGQFKPTDFFGSLLSPLLFGCIPLGELIKAVGGLGDFGEMPSFVTEALQEGEALFANLGQLDGIESAMVAMVKTAAEAAIRQAVELAFAQVGEQLAVLDAQTAALQTQAQAVASAAQALASVLGSASPALLADPGQLAGVLTSLKNAVQALVAAVTSRDDALKLPGADGLADSTRTVVRQQLALIRQRIAQVQALLADLAGIPALVDAAKALYQKVSLVLVSPDQLKTLLANGGLATRLGELKSALAAFEPALTALHLLDGAAKQTLLGLVETLIEVLGALDTLLPVMESLLGDEIVVRLAFAPTLAPWPPASGHALSGLGRLFDPHDPKGFVVAVEARVKKSGGTPVVKVRCGLNRFDLNLLGDKDSAFIRLEFQKIEFSADSSLKTHVDVDFSGIHFIGVLSFVEALRDLIPLDGFSDPPSLTVDEKGIQAAFSMALPNLAVGVMSLTNLSLGAGFTVPFIGQPLAVSFNFCTREAPFNLTVSLFGGGGFFGIAIDPHGVQMLEAAFEFGASISIDFGVASGGVHVMAGIYFRMEPERASLTGYFRLGGYVDVLGLISASLELYMDLTYIFEEGKCIGRASLTIEVHVLFFSIGVEITCERKFAGSSGDPSFAALMGPIDPGADLTTADYGWRDYCEAFA